MLLILAAGVGLSYLAFRAADFAEDERARNVLELRAEWRARDLEDKLAAAATPVEALADFIPSQTMIDPDEFHRFAIQARRMYPLTRLAWAPLVDRDDRAAFQATARTQGLPNYAITDYDGAGIASIAPERDQYLPTRLVEAFDGGQVVPGFDLLSDPARRALVEEARDRGQPVAAPPRPVPGLNVGGPPNYVVFWPVYKGGLVPFGQAERRASFAGVVIGNYPLPAIMTFAMQESPETQATLDLFIEARPGAPLAAPLVSYEPLGGHIDMPTSPLAEPAAGALRLTRTFTLFDHQWTLLLDFPPGVVAELRNGSQWGYLAAGLLLTLALVAYLLSEQKRRSRVEAEIAERTQELRGTTDQLRTVIAASPLAIAVLDPDLKVTGWNRAAEQISGYAAEEVLGARLPASFGAESETQQAAGVRALQGEVIRSLEITRRRKDGRMIETSTSVAALLGPDSQLVGVIVTMEDITVRNQMDRHLQQAQKMEAIGQLTGGLAHDFNNLLGVILGNLEILKDHHQLDAEQTEIVEAAIHAGVRGAELTRQLLAFARQQPLAPTLVDLHETLGKAARLLARTLGEHIIFELKLSEDVRPVMVDAAQLESAILNLAVNARDAMPEGGRLTAEAANVTIDEVAAEINAEAAAGDYVAIAVSDTGTGMTPDVLARAFDPFFTTKAGKGTGLGLSMVHGFVKQSGGYTRIYSEPGRGTTIRMYLPSKANAAAESETGAPAPLTSHGGETILVVEDNVALRDVALRQLKVLGYLTIAAGDAAEALSIIKTDAKIDLLFTDVVMPGGMDGRALAEAAKIERPGLRMLFTSGFTPAAASAAVTLEVGGNLLSKPYRREELARRVRAAIDGEA